MTVEIIVPPILCLLLGYALGSIPFGLLLTKAAGLGDVRAIGSGNIGATNVLRTGRKGLAAATLLLDAAKGAAAVLLAGLVWPDHGQFPALAGIGAFLGHLFPLWLRFRGGKGVATLAGDRRRLALADDAGRGRALGRDAGADPLFVARPGWCRRSPGRSSAALFGRFDLAILFAGFALLVLWTHRANIGRLIDGAEPEGRAGLMPVPADRIARLRLIRSENIGPVTYFQLLARFGSAQAAIDAIPDLAARGGGRAPRLASRAEVEREMAEVERLGARYLFLGQGLYPPLLAELETAPPALIVKGDLNLLDRMAVALVGARNASAAACRFARGLAQALGATGAIIVSGLARGVDSAAHDGALDSGTIAVIAGGIDIVYPPENEARQRAIAERGLLVAEQPPGIEPHARHFPYRNRIIAGLTHGTVVVEAAPRSGSLITARYAAEFGREVMAVPGSPLDPRAQGCNLLIRDGATLVQTAEDVLEAISPLERPPVPPARARLCRAGAERGRRRDGAACRCGAARADRRCRSTS